MNIFEKIEYAVIRANSYIAQNGFCDHVEVPLPMPAVLMGKHNEAVDPTMKSQIATVYYRELSNGRAEVRRIDLPGDYE